MQLLDLKLLSALHVLQNLLLHFVVWSQHRCKLYDLSLLRDEPLFCETDLNRVLLEDATRLNIDEHLISFLCGLINDMLYSFLLPLLLFFLLGFLLDRLYFLLHLLLVLAEDSDALRMPRTAKLKRDVPDLLIILTKFIL